MIIKTDSYEGNTRDYKLLDKIYDELNSLATTDESHWSPSPRARLIRVEQIADSIRLSDLTAGQKEELLERLLSTCKSFAGEVLEDELATNYCKQSLLPIRKQVAWSGMIQQYGPFSTFLTLNFSRAFSRRNTDRYAREFWKILNEELFGKDHLINGDSLDCIAVAEPTKFPPEKEGTDHHHMLISQWSTESSGISVPAMKTASQKAIRRVKDAKGRSVSSPNIVDCREVLDEEYLVNYVTKESVRLFNEFSGRVYVGTLDFYRSGEFRVDK